MAEVVRRRRTLVIVATIAVVAVVIGAVAWLVISNRGPERSASALCARLADANALDAALVTLDPTMLGPQIAALQHAVDVAPDDIRAQLTELSDFVAEIGEEVRAAPTDKKQVLVEALARRQDRVDAIAADGQAVELWSETNCGTRLRASTSTTRSTTTTVPPATTSTTARSTSSSSATSSTTVRSTTTTR